MRIFEKLRAIFNFKGRRAEMELKSAEIREDKIFLHPENDPDHTFCVSGRAIDILIDPSVSLTEDDFRIIENKKLDALQKQMEIDPTVPLEKLLGIKPQKEDAPPPKPKETPDAKSPSQPVAETDPKAELNAKSEAKSDSRSRKMQESKQPETVAEKKNQGQQTPRKTERIQPPPGPKMHVVSMRLYPEEYEFLMATIEEKGYKKTEYLLTCVAFAANKKTIETNYQKYYAQRMLRRKKQREAAKRVAEGQDKKDLQVGA